MKCEPQPVALTIAGSDSGGGAGLQADLKVFAALDVHGASVVTCLTAQNPTAVLGVHPCPPNLVVRQLEAVFSELPPAALKTGMLFSTAIIRAVVGFLQSQRRRPLIVDPVMVATSGAPLLQPSAVRALREELLPLATLVTPNLDEASILVSRPLPDPESARRAAREIHHRFGCAALVKGGHWTGVSTAVDFFYDGREELLLEAPFLRQRSTHGTGCTYSAAITAYLASGRSLTSAVQAAKFFVTQAIAQSRRIRRHLALNPFWKD